VGQGGEEARREELMPLPEGIRSILFSLPTICDAAPETIPNPGNDGGEAFRLHEDDWRQIEFIPASALAQVDRELAKVEAFKRAHWTGSGFKSVYIRKERPDGLYPGRVSYGLIDSIPHDPIERLKIGTIGTPQREQIIKGGFACRLSPSAFLYGRQAEGIIVDLGLSRLPKESGALQSVLSFCNKCNLCIVDWCAGNISARPAPLCS
jgi:hypothetical protein